MKKIGIIFDTSSNLTYEKAKDKGVELIPLVINFNSQLKRGNVDINAEFLYNNMKKGKTRISTASPILQDVINAFNGALKDNDEAVFIGISKKFSGTINSARLVVKQHPEFQGKIHIYESQYAAPYIELLIDQIIDIVKSTDDLNEIYNKLNFQNDKMIGWLSPKDIYWFYSGGRITKTQYLIGSAVKLVPVLTVRNGEINQDSVIKAISIKGGIKKMIGEARKKVEEFENNNVEYKFVSLYAGDNEVTKMTKDAIVREFGVAREDIIVSELGPEQIAHMGPGAFGITFTVNFK